MYYLALIIATIPATAVLQVHVFDRQCSTKTLLSDFPEPRACRVFPRVTILLVNIEAGSPACDGLTKHSSSKSNTGSNNTLLLLVRVSCCC